MLTAPKGAKKRKVSEVSPADGYGVGSRTPQPLVGISANVPTENTRSRRSKGGDARRPGATISSPPPRPAPTQYIGNVSTYSLTRPY